MSNTHVPGKAGKRILKVIMCCFLVLFTLFLMAVVGLGMACNLILNGPSKNARNALTVSLLASDTTAWIPSLFLDEQTLAQIQAGETVLQPEAVPDAPQVVINFESGTTDQWADYPDGIRIETIHGRTYTAHVMLIRDPSRVYLATSSDSFNISINGNRIFGQMQKE